MDNRLGVIKTLAMPTCNRVDSAASSLRTFIENSLKFDLECDYVVYDDSRSAQVREKYRAMLGQLRKEFGVPLFYAGFEEKVSFLKTLFSFADVSPELAKFALFDVHKHGASTLGGNRNAALLDNPGRAFVTVDDDTFCSISTLANATEDVEFVAGDLYSVSDPCDFVTFSDRKQLLESLTRTEAPFLQIHGSLLGKSAHELRTGRADEDAGGGKVLLTFNGLAGDCAWAPFASYIYFFVTGSSLSRLTSKGVYEAARSSREILRVARRIFITSATAAPGAFFGMDNRDLLPPFMPLGGAEDTFYWEMKRKCFPDDFFGHLPWALLHEPASGRYFRPADMRRSREGFDFYTIMMAFLRSLSPVNSSISSPALRLLNVGKEFEALGALPVAKFESKVKSLLHEDVERIKANLSRKLEENSDGCDLWHQDLEYFLRDSWSLLDHPDVAVPVDFLCLRGREGALELARTLISQYGRLLGNWPQMVHGATELWKAGIRLARPVA